MKKSKIGVLIAILTSAAAFASPLDEAVRWWRFDEGGADGTVAQTSEIHDVRNASQGVATGMTGPNGGPLWTNVTVRLPNSRVERQCTALNFQVVTNTSNQARPTQVNVSDGYSNTDSVTFFARFCPGEQLFTQTSERFLYNNNFRWASTKADSWGQLFGIAINGANYYSPRLFIGQESCTAGGIKMEIGKWYEMAISIENITNTTQRVLFVVAGDEGLRYQTIDLAFRRTSSFTGTTSRMGGQNYATGYNNIGSNVVNLKAYNGLIHEMALWDNALSLAEILDVFGRGTAKSDADPYADAVRWWRFDRDLDGDGIVTANELRDVRLWGTADTPASGNAELEYLTDGGPLSWRNMSVLAPARGDTASADCLVLEPEYRTTDDGSYQCWSPRLRFTNSSVAGDFTAVSRICITKECDFISGSKACYIVGSGFSWGGLGSINSGGYQFGVTSVGSSTTNFNPIIYAGYYATAPTSLVLTTNTWYDIAYTVSPQSDTNDHITIALADAEHGIRTWSGTLPTSQRLMTATSLMIGGENNSRGWETYCSSNGTIVSLNALKNFTGAINHLAVWRRVLSTKEIAMAFGYPRATFGVGTEDGTAGEFAASDEGSYDYTASDTWHDMAGTLDSTHRTLTLRFTPPKGWNGMDQGFHLVVGDVSGSGVKVSLTINGARFGSQDVGTGSNLWWNVKGGCILSGENVATLTVSGTGSYSMEVDKVEMLGSWSLVSGTDGNYFSHENGAQNKDFYVGDANMAHVTRAVTAGNPRNRLNFYVPEELSANYPFEFTFTMHGHENGTAAFKFTLNGTEIFDAPNGLVGESRTLAFDAGVLQPGWNVIEMIYQTGGGSWAQVVDYKLEMQGPNIGTIFFVR